MKPTSIERKQFSEKLKRKIHERIEAGKFRQELKQVTWDYHAAASYINQKFPEPKTISFRDFL
ncbi:MAG: hypothetical protein IMF10_06650 [Proteobacteria bacterium]|nr:hypothetical protein [Pseudomonadota bacterium]